MPIGESIIENRMASRTDKQIFFDKFYLIILHFLRFPLVDTRHIDLCYFVTTLWTQWEHAYTAVNENAVLHRLFQHVTISFCFSFFKRKKNPCTEAV